jgi:two-component system LytT family response regulator
MIKAIIVEDEQHCVDRLLYLISSYTNTLNIIAICNTVSEGVKATNELQPDLVFLDIEINNQTGFDYLKQITNINFEIIFTTAFENYAIKAIKFSAFDYLLKPIDEDDFKGTIKRLNEKLLQPSISEQVEVLLHNLNSKEASKRITIPTAEGLIFLDIIDIIYCEADASYTHIFTTSNSKLTVSKPLKHFENLLQNNDFFRIHSAHLVNLNHVKKYTKGKGGYVTMSNNDAIDVSTRRKNEFLNLLSNKF